MRRTYLLAAILLSCTLSAAAPKKHSYLFAWCGDIESKASDFLAVIDADPTSPQYGKVLESLPTGVAGSVPHHTEVPHNISPKDENATTFAKD
jgi:56kDa selenium binding protein (SBP56)